MDKKTSSNLCNCKEYKCGLTIKEIKLLLAKAEGKILEISLQDIKRYNWGGECQEDISAINTYSNILNKYISQLTRTKESCICDEYIREIYKKLNDIVGNVKIKLEDTTDRSKEVEWIKANPMCVSKERWKIVAYKICRELEIEITVEEILCNYTLDITLENISCDILTALSSSSIECKTGVTTTIEEKDCKIEHTLLIEKHPQGPDLSVYKLAVNKFGLNYDKIKLIYDNGLTLGINKLGNCTINTVIDSYDLTTITYNKIITEIP